MIGIACRALVLAAVLLGCHGTTPPPRPPEPNKAPDASPADVTIRVDAIVVGDTPIVPLPPDRSHGAPASAKHGERGHRIFPLGDALAKRAARGKGLVVDIDPSTPFGLLVEVVYTIEESAPELTLRVLGAPTRWLRPTRRARPFPGLLAIVVSDGVSLKGPGGNVAPGCTDVGPGLAVPRIDGRIDLASLRSCARRLSGLPSTADIVTVTATDAIEFGELFPNVALGYRWPTSPATP